MLMLFVNFIKLLYTMLFAICHIGFYMFKLLKGAEDNKKITDKQSQEYEMASAVETKDDIEDTEKYTNEQNFAVATTNIYVNSEITRQININRLNFCDNTKSVQIFKYKYVIGNSTFDTAETQDVNYYKLKIRTSKIDVQRECAYNKGEDIESNSANIKRIHRRKLDDEPAQLVGSIFLTEYSLNAIIVNEDNYHKKYYCCICRLEFEQEKINLHMKSRKHLKALKLAPPLENNACIRYIHDQYHCAVCDTLFKGPLSKHLTDNKHILYLSLAQVKSRKLRKHGIVNERPKKKKRRTKRKSKNNRQNGNLPISLSFWDSDEDYDNLLKAIRQEVASQENKNLPSPVPVKSAYEENCHLLKSAFPDYYNLTESSYQENYNLLASSENYNLLEYKKAYEGNCNFPNSATPEFYNFPKYKVRYEENYNLPNSAYPEIYNFPIYKEGYEANCNFPNSATAGIYNFPKYKEAYEENCNILKSTFPEIYGFPNYKEAYEENYNLLNSATPELYKSPKYKEAYKENNSNLLNLATPEICNFPIYKAMSKENCNSPKYEESYEENSNILKSTFPEIYDIPKHKEASEENFNLDKTASPENFNLPEYKEDYEENCNILKSVTPENFNLTKSSYKEKHNAPESVCREYCHLPKADFEENSAEIVLSEEKNESIDKLKIKIVDDELENFMEFMYEAKVFNHSSGLVVEFLGSALRVDVNSYNFIREVSEMDMFCMICGYSLDSNEFNSHIEKVEHVVNVKNAQYNPVYGCHLLRPLSYKNYHCSLCNEEFNKKTLTMHILSDKHKMRLMRSLIRDWNGGDGDYHENCLMMPKKEPPVLPILESVGNSDVADLKFLQKEREIVLSNNVEFGQPVSGLEDAKTDEIVSEDLNDLSYQELSNVKMSAAKIKSSDYVHVKLGGVFLTVGLNNYHSLFLIGDGRRRCFVCSVNVDNNIEDHVTDKRHLDNVSSVRFVKMFSTKVFRKKNVYHCLVCNLVMFRSKVKAHIEASHHKDMMRASQMVSLRT